MEKWDLYSDGNDLVKSKIDNKKEVGKIAAFIFLNGPRKMRGSILVKSNDSFSLIRGIQFDSDQRFKYVGKCRCEFAEDLFSLPFSNLDRHKGIKWFWGLKKRSCRFDETGDLTNLKSKGVGERLK